MFRLKTKLTLTLLFLLIPASCNEDGLRGSNGGVRARSGNIVSVCDANSQASNGQGAISGFPGTKMQVEGEFCTISLDPGQDPALNVLFVVDFSGSMEGADQGNGTTCGRLDAANTILANIVPPGTTDRDGKPPLVNVGAVSFGSQAQTQFPMTPINQSPPMTFGNFCLSNANATNYEAAFQQAQAALAGTFGPKLVYFVSDGLPTVGGTSTLGSIFGNGNGDRTDAKNKGIEASTALRSNPDVQLNVLFLVNNDPVYSDPSEPDPVPYLQQVAGPPINGQTNVVVAQNAGELARKIQLLDRPPPSTIRGNDGLRGQLSAPNFGTRNVGVKLQQSNVQTGKYRYITDSFELFGSPGQQVVNTLKVVASSSDGTRPESTTTITFTQKNGLSLK